MPVRRPVPTSDGTTGTIQPDDQVYAIGEAFLNLADTPHREYRLAEVADGEIRGTGARTARRWESHGICGTLQLSNADEGWIGNDLGVVGLRFVHELRRLSCFAGESCPSSQQRIAVSRLFMQALDRLNEQMGQGHSVMPLPDCRHRGWPSSLTARPPLRRTGRISFRSVLEKLAGNASARASTRGRLRLRSRRRFFHFEHGDVEREILASQWVVQIEHNGLFFQLQYLYRPAVGGL